VPAVVIWALLGLLVNLAPLNLAALALIAAYGAYYGRIEAFGLPGLPPPSRTWQVPAPWVDHAPKWRRIAVWGSLLGPGFATRNPYAGFGLLPLIVASVGEVRVGIAFAAVIGFLHAAGRALALLRDVRRIASADYMLSVMRSIRWRAFDGLELLTVTGVAIATLVHHL
jgi:hypothetical protein